MIKVINDIIAFLLSCFAGSVSKTVIPLRLQELSAVFAVSVHDLRGYLFSSFVPLFFLDSFLNMGLFFRSRV